MSTLPLRGTTVVRTTPWPCWPHYDPDEVEAAAAVLRSGKVNYWTGQEGRSFEKEYAAALGVKHAVAVANGTVAIEFALRALGIKPGDEVVVTPRTFVASAYPVVLAGATPVFADVDRDSGVITAASIAAVLTPRTRAVVPVHLAGWPCDMDAIMALAKDRGFHVIEDCAQAHGATWNGRPVGSFGHVNCFSFCQDKIITTGGEGGLVTTNDERIWSSIWSFKDHGKSFDAVYKREHPPGFRWLHEGFGTNGRMTEIQSAIGRIQLRKLPEWTRRRRQNSEYLSSQFAQFPALRVSQHDAKVGHACYKYYCYVRPEKLAPGWDRDRIMTSITALGVPAFSGSCSEIYLEKSFPTAGLGPKSRLPIARELGETSLMFLVHPTVEQTDLDDLVPAVRTVLEKATR